MRDGDAREVLMQSTAEAKLAFLVPAVLGLLLLLGCAPTPLVPYSTETPPMMLAPISVGGGGDGRARFREIYCAVTEEHGRALPDYRPCDKALVKLENEGPPTGKPVDLGPSKSPLQVFFVPGLGWTCFEQFVAPTGAVASHLAKFGHDVQLLRVESLSSSSRNARLIRDALMARPPEDRKRIVLIGYSKGATDVLEAITAYPELQERVAAVVSLAGSVGGSALAYDATQSTVNLLKRFPGAQCDVSDEGSLESLKPSVRQSWLASSPLPRGVRYYSLVTYPAPEEISKVLRSGYRKLSTIDPRNDSQLFFYDQVVPSSMILGYLNADHWAVGVPIARSHPHLAATLVDRNAFPREVLMEALLRFIEEDGP
jgi:hypothetical protein